MSSPDRHARAPLPIPDRSSPGLTTDDAKDTDTAFAPIEPLLPPRGAPNVLVVLLDDVGFGVPAEVEVPDGTTRGVVIAQGGRFGGFGYDGGGLGKGGDLRLHHDGEPVGSGRVELTQPAVFPADETTDIGHESGTPVSPDYTAAAGSPGASTGCSSTSVTTTMATSSTPTRWSASPWRGSRGPNGPDRRARCVMASAAWRHYRDGV